MNSFIIGTLFSGPHIFIIIAALLLFFGGKKIPELMGGLGKGMKEFKKAMKDDEQPIDQTEEKKKEALKE